MSATVERTVTTRFHIPWNAATSRRIWEACRLQSTAHNRAVEHLLDHPEEPLRKTTAKGVTGLFGRWLDWRAERESLAAIPQTLWRGGVIRAKGRIDRWETTNAEYAALVVKAADTEREIPARVQRRIPRPERLYERRSITDRRGRNHCTVLEGVRRIDAHTLQVRGIGQLRTREAIPDDFVPRSCTIVERTPAARRQRAKGKLPPEERTFRIHIQSRAPAPAARQVASSVGVDHGIRHAMTTSDDAGESTRYDHAREPKLNRRKRRLKRRRARACRKFSRQWRRLGRRARAASQRATRLRAHERLVWANQLASRYDLVAVEKLDLKPMLASRRGTHERHGSKVVAQRRRSRALAGIAPGLMTAAIDAACQRHGAHFVPVDATETSITCSQCGHADTNSRKSQGRFVCTQCSQRMNADVNAAENVRLAGVEKQTGRGQPVQGPQGPEAPSRAPRTPQGPGRRGRGRGNRSWNEGDSVYPKGSRRPDESGNDDGDD